VANEELGDLTGKDWGNYFREMYPKITKEALKEFELKYKGKVFSFLSFFLFLSSFFFLITITITMQDLRKSSLMSRRPMCLRRVTWARLLTL
jgi:hypothetical protein